MIEFFEKNKSKKVPMVGVKVMVLRPGDIIPEQVVLSFMSKALAEKDSPGDFVGAITGSVVNEFLKQD